MQSIGLKSGVGQQSISVLSGLTCEGAEQGGERDPLLIKYHDVDTVSILPVSSFHSLTHSSMLGKVVLQGPPDALGVGGEVRREL